MPMSIVIVHAFRRIADEGLVVQDGVLAGPPTAISSSASLSATS